MGDMPRTGSRYLSTEARRKAERAAFDDIVEAVGERHKKVYSELHEDYEERTSLEARLVKAADVIDLLLQALLFEKAGARGLDEFWENIGERDLQLESHAKDLVRELLDDLSESHHAIVDSPR